MITQNYKNFLQTLFSGVDASVVTTDGKTLYFANGATSGSFVPMSYCPGKLLLMKSTGGNGFCLGRGSTPASASDYTLEDMIVSSYEIVFPNKFSRIVNVEGKTIYTTTYTIRNTGGTDLIINEVGLIGQTRTYTYAGYTSSSSNTSNMLIDRTVLPEPLTIPAGEIRALTYNLVFDLSFE